MSTPEERWWVVRAGEYVLGTLRGRDLELFEEILRADTAMQQEVARWEQQLVPLNESTITPVPGEHVWPAIAARVRASIDAANEQRASRPGGSDPGGSGSAQAAIERDVPADVRPDQPLTLTAEPPPVTPAASGAVVRRFTLLWPGIAAVATVASLLLGILVQQQASEFDALRFQLDGVSIVETDADGTALFYIETDYENQRVRIVSLAPPEIEAQQNLQLWQALPPGEEGVRPVALLPTEPGVSRSYDVGSLIENSELFGVSIEPEGAPTDQGPTGPVIAHGDFVKAGSAREQ